MQSSPAQPLAASSLEDQQQAFQDHFIQARLPHWLTAAHPEQLRGLAEALRRSVGLRHQVSALLERIEGIDTFALARLESALQARYHEQFRVRRWSFIAGSRQLVINSQPVGAHLTELVYSDMPLLEAALRNFTAEQASAAGQPRGNRLTSARQGFVTAPSAIEFAQLCRQLDLGAAYQQHLDSVLRVPTGDGQQAAALLGELQREQMLVDGYRARLSGVLKDDELALIIGLCRDGVAPRLNGHPVVAKRLRLLDCELEQIVVLDVIEEGFLRNATMRLLAYVPGDPHGPWSVFDSARRLANGLGRRLRNGQYQRFFSRFVRRRDSQRFFSIIIPAYADLAVFATIDLHQRLHAYRSPLFEALGAARIEQIKDDAAMIAVPVADLDRAVQQAHDQRLEAEGWALLNLAGLFIPAVGAGLLALTAWQLLTEVFQGVEAWHEGDTQAAMDHVMHVATDVAVMASVGLGVAVVSRAWQRSAWVDGLLPAQLEEGTTRLARVRLEDYRSPAPASQVRPDEQGVYRDGEQAWIEMDSHYYPVVQRASDGAWQLCPRDGYGPRLSHNGAGAWRLWYEQPAQWQDPHRLFRRLGGEMSELDDEQIDQLLVAHGLQADHLRALHVLGHAPEALLLDSVQRMRLDRRISALLSDLRSGVHSDDGALLQQARSLPQAAGLADQALAERVASLRRVLFDAAYQASQGEGDAHVQALRQAFPSLHEQAARSLLRGAQRADRQRLVDTGRVPLRLAEAARVQALQIRQARAFEALYLEVPQTLDLARVTLGMIERLPGGGQVRWALFDGAADVSLQVNAPAGARSFGVRHGGGQFSLLDAQDMPMGEPGELFETLARAYDDSQRAAFAVGEPFAHNLRVLVTRQAARQRDEVMRLLAPDRAMGWFRAPQRLPEGRFGYPLSGRRLAGEAQRASPAALFAMVRSLFPTYSDAQVVAWIEQARSSGVDPHAEIARLENQLHTLERHLRRWVRQGERGAQREERRYIQQSLLDCWQHRVTTNNNSLLTTQHFRLAIFAAEPGVLPELPERVSFAHVHELALLGMDLETVPQGFLHVFPNLRILELNGNRLTQLPSGLDQLRELRELDLFGNRIVLDTAQANMLARCDSLEYLNLSFNPLGRGFSLQSLARLRRLHLRGTGQTELPPSILRCPDLLQADLRDNQINRLPAWFMRSPMWTRRMIMLWGNPLPANDLQMLRASMPSLGAELQAPVEATRVRRRWLDATAGLARDQRSAFWEAVEVESGSEDFFRLLARLLDTADFAQRSDALAERVFTMLQAMHDNASLRETLFEQVTRQLTCQDSAALSFSNLELSMLVWRARVEAGTGGQEGALLHLGRQLWRLDEVERIVLEDIQARRASGADPDEIEVGLAYRIGLRDVLDLPAQPGDMLFAQVSGVDAPRLAGARERVEAAENDEAVAASLVQRDFWQAYLERTEAEAFEVADQPFHERLQALLDTAESVPEAEYLARVGAVDRERQAARQQLLLALTRKALAALVRPAS
nr:NEL-type E3 ubiquitin ligase domain-containing protein [uncultured Pseudomonas sp.]